MTFDGGIAILIGSKHGGRVVISPSLAVGVVDRLEAAVQTGSGTVAESEIENLADVIVGALIYRNGEVTSALHPRIAQLYAQARAVEEPSAWQRVMAGQLRALTTVISAAARRQPAADQTELARDPKYRPLLNALRGANAPLTNQQIAERAKVTEETVARNLPALRAAGLVTARRAWKRRLNTLTTPGYEALLATEDEELEARPRAYRPIGRRRTESEVSFQNAIFKFKQNRIDHVFDRR